MVPSLWPQVKEAVRNCEAGDLIVSALRAELDQKNTLLAQKSAVIAEQSARIERLEQEMSEARSLSARGQNGALVIVKASVFEGNQPIAIFHTVTFSGVMILTAASGRR